MHRRTARLPGAPLRRSLAVLLLAASTAVAAEPTTLELRYGPDETRWLALEGLRVLVDGTEVPVALPLPADAGRPVHRGPLATGSRRLEVEATLRGDSAVFTYVDGYRFTMRGHLALEVTPGDVVGVTARVVAADGLTVRWQDRYRLALSATVTHSPRALEEALAAALAEPAAPPTPVPAPAPPAPGPAPATAQVAPRALAQAGPAATPAGGTCTLEPVRFSFDSAELSPDARQALGRFAACLVRTSATVRLTGHWDELGPPEYNAGLGERRARAAAALLQEAGVAPARLQVIPVRESTPLCQEATRACWARNRRVEATVSE